MNTKLRRNVLDQRPHLREVEHEGEYCINTLRGPRHIGLSSTRNLGRPHHFGLRIFRIIVNALDQTLCRERARRHR